MLTVVGTLQTQQIWIWLQHNPGQCIFLSPAFGQLVFASAIWRFLPSPMGILLGIVALTHIEKSW